MYRLDVYMYKLEWKGIVTYKNCYFFVILNQMKWGFCQNVHKNNFKVLQS